MVDVSFVIEARAVTPLKMAMLLLKPVLKRQIDGDFCHFFICLRGLDRGNQPWLVLNCLWDSGCSQRLLCQFVVKIESSFVPGSLLRLQGLLASRSRSLGG